MPDPVQLSVVIPSYGRGAIVLDTIRMLEALAWRASEILVVDQTPRHPDEVESQLSELDLKGRIRWIRLPQPSIPAAMNEGLRVAKGQAVLFLDDDIVPGDSLCREHAEAQVRPGLVAGQVLQPGQEPISLAQGQPFRFNSSTEAAITEFMGGNFSVDREQARLLGGFDENFVGAAYRFEAEFASRYTQALGDIRFLPAASIRHLAIPSGGTRAHGHHLRSSTPAHSVGAYYFLMKTRRPGWLVEVLKRPMRSVRTRHHLQRPWWIPVTLLAETRGFFLALRYLRDGAKLPFKHL